MAFKAAKCPSCAGELQIPDDKDKVKCMYCGSDIIVREAIRAGSGANIENILKLARVADESDNHEDAYKYYSQVLEYDSQNVESWLGRGKAAGWQSTLAKPRIEEVMSCYKQANSIGIKDDDILAKSALELNNIAIAIYNGAQSHMEKFKHSTPSSGFLDAVANAAKDAAYNKQLAIEFYSYAEKTTQAMEFAWKMKPQVIIAANMVTICNKIPALKVLSSEQNEEFKKKAIEWEQKAKELDPSWEKPKSGCFVATATMGDYNHPDVIQLRQFRDDFLLCSSLGRSFIKSYYSFGPYFAKVILKSRILRLISCYLLVKPLSYLSKRIVKIAKGN